MQSARAVQDGYFANIQALRALAVLLVIFYHQRIVEAKYFDAHTVGELLGRYGMGGVDLFFVISGFVMVIATRDRFEASGEAARFLLARVLRIYPVYWFYTLVVFAVMVVKPAWVNSASGDPNLIASFTLFPSEELPLVIQGWTLSYEMYFYLVFALAIALIARRRLPLWLGAWACLTAIGHLYLNEGTDEPALLLVTDLLSLEFMAGCVGGLVYRRLNRATSWLLLGLGLLACGASALLAESQDYHRVVELRAFYFGIPSFLLVTGAAGVEAHSMVRAPRALVFLGEASYSLYLSHLLALAAVGRFWQATLLPHAGSAWGTLACIAVAIAGGCMAYAWIERPLNARVKRWAWAHERAQPQVAQRR